MNSRYFGVIGNRDHIKRHKGTEAEEKRPFWEYLDEHPTGWLTSITYKREDLPHTENMIYDCGAWSYKTMDVPPIDAKSAFEFYKEHAPDHCMCIAPDHMLIDGVDLDFRRQWNYEQAARFLDLLPEHLTPMACVHGQTLDERLKCAETLLALGYGHLAIGGVAARATQKKLTFALVAALREETMGNYLHVLGLSSPEYAAKWETLGVDSFDGASHFKQAFTAGAFFTQTEHKLTKHRAARPGEDIIAPECFCTACDLLRRENIDTRQYGSNENNMGRAAHNMNMLIRAQKIAMNNPSVFNVK